MILGITIMVLGVVIGVVLTVKNDVETLLFFGPSIAGLILGVVLMGCGFNIPDKSVKYVTFVKGQELIFDKYSYDGDNIVVPTHYQHNLLWVNYWQYCESPITIVPNGVIIDINLRNPPEPYIIGGCQ